MAQNQNETNSTLKGPMDHRFLNNLSFYMSALSTGYVIMFQEAHWSINVQSKLVFHTYFLACLFEIQSFIFIIYETIFSINISHF